MQSINPKIFKAYDIRGIYPDELNKDSAFLIGHAFAKKTKAKQVVVGRDMRHGGGTLKNNLVKGLAAGGVKEIIDIGLVPIDAIYFSVTKLKYQSGIMITASHNPREYNGFKMIGKNSTVVRGVDLWPIVKKSVLSSVKKSAPKIKIKKVNIYPAYIKHILSFVETDKIKPLKVVVDAGNGMAGKVMPLLAKHLPIKIIPLFFKLDGSFPHHPSNPLDPRSQIAVSKKVKQAQADLGVIFDGDTDRLFFIDERGKFIAADITLLLLAKQFLEKHKPETIAYNLICSKMVEKKIKAWGGKPIKTAVGFVNVAEALKKHQGVMGGELSAHYSFRENGYFDSGFIALVIMLQFLSAFDRPLSKIIKPFDKYYKLPEINTPVKDIQQKIKEIKQRYKKYKQNYLDGVTIDNWNKPNGWWFNVRPSNTEPLLRLTIEAKNKATALKLKKELVKVIKG